MCVFKISLEHTNNADPRFGERPHQYRCTRRYFLFQPISVISIFVPYQALGRGLFICSQDRIRTCITINDLDH
jgi:hypothetical protein